MSDINDGSPMLDKPSQAEGDAGDSDAPGDVPEDEDDEIDDGVEADEDLADGH